MFRKYVVRLSLFCVLLFALLWIPTSSHPAMAAGNTGEAGTIFEIEVWSQIPPNPYHELTVHVKNEEGASLPQIAVKVYPKKTDGTRGDVPVTGAPGGYMTDENGRILFSLPPGDYQVVVEHTGYQLYQGEWITFSEEKDIEIILKKKEAKQPDQGFTDALPTHTVTYHAGSGGSFAMGGGPFRETVITGQRPRAVPEPVPNPGYRFMYWKEVDGWLVDSPTRLIITGSTTLYAIFEEEREDKVYTVYYQVTEGGWLDGPNQESVVHGKKPTSPPTPVAAPGKVFIGWVDGKNQLVQDPTEMEVFTNTLLYAVFEDANPKDEYMVYYHAESGGRLEGLAEEIVLRWDSPKNPPSPVNTAGFYFINWIDQYGREYADLSKLVVTEDTWLYARFENALASEDEVYTVYYWAGTGGTLSGGRTSETVAHGDYPRYMPTPIPEEGYEFVGWLTQEDYVVRHPEELQIMQDMTLRAHFEQKADGGITTVNNSASDSDGVPTEEESDISDTDLDVREETPGFPVPDSSDGLEDTEPNAEEICWLHWILLLCMLVSTLIICLRIYVLRKDRERGRTRRRYVRTAWTTEILGFLICIAVELALVPHWHCKWDPMVAILWAILLLLLGILLVRAERKAFVLLREGQDRNGADTGE